MGTVRVRIVILTVRITLSVCPFNRIAHTANMLRAFDGTPGNTIDSKFWSVHHCFRRGARSQVSRGGNFGCHRFSKAYKTQVYEHGPWRRRRGSEEIDIIYRAWTFLEKLQITLVRM
jgi:hypothetical protein